MRVILRPIGKNAWSGLTKYRNCYEDIGPYFTRSGRVYTGLTTSDEKRLGEILGLDLTPHSDYWKEFYVRTMGKDIYLDLDDPQDELKYLFLKNHKRVKTSLLENKATANFVLVNKDEEAKRENIFNKVRRDAIKAFDKLSPEETRKCLRLFGHNGDSLSNEVAENKLFNIVEANPQTFLDKWVNNPNRETTVLIEKAISKNVIRKNKNIYKYGSDVIGHTLEETISFLEDPKNQDIRITVLKSIESKDSIQTSEPVDQVFDEAFNKTAPKDVDVIDEEGAPKARTAGRRKGDTI